MTKKVRALAIGGATLDTIIEYKDMMSMIMQKRGDDKCYMLIGEGDKVEVEKSYAFSGGGATNAAVNFKKQDLDVNFFGKVGSDNSGAIILNELHDYGIGTSDVKFSKKHGTATSYVIPTLSGDRTIFAYRGANVTILADDLPVNSIKKADFVYITSLSSKSAARLPEIVKEAQKHHTKVAINPGASQLAIGGGFIKESLFGIDILIVNYNEAKKLMISLVSTKKQQVINRYDRSKNLLEQENEVYQDSTFSIKKFFKYALDLGPQIIIVTDGGNGVYVGTEEKLYFSKSLKIDNVVNTLGAGDSFGSTFAACIYKGGSIEEAIKNAIINSGSVVQVHDAKSGLLTIDEITKRKEQLNKIMNKNITYTNW